MLWHHKRHQVWGWPGDNHLTYVLWSTQLWPQDCLPQSVNSFQESGCLKDSARFAPTRRSTWLTWTMTRWPWHSLLLFCYWHIFAIIVIRSRLCSGGSLTKTITSPRPPQTRAWRRSWREYQTLSRYYPHLLISGWVFFYPQFPIFLITPKQYNITIHSICLACLPLLSPNCIVIIYQKVLNVKIWQTCFICTVSYIFLSLFTFSICITKLPSFSLLWSLFGHFLENWLETFSVHS